MQAKQNRNKFNEIIIFKILPLWSSFLGLHVNYYFLWELVLLIVKQKKIAKMPNSYCLSKGRVGIQYFF